MEHFLNLRDSTKTKCRSWEGWREVIRYVYMRCKMMFLMSAHLQGGKGKQGDKRTLEKTGWGRGRIDDGDTNPMPHE